MMSHKPKAVSCVLASFRWLYGFAGTGSGVGAGQKSALSGQRVTLNERDDGPHPCSSPQRHPLRGHPHLWGQKGEKRPLGPAS